MDCTVLGSGIHGADKAALKRFSSATGCRLLDKWSTGVTHVVCLVDENRRAKRTVKYMLGLAAGCHVVAAEWMEACLTAGAPVPEDK